MNEEAYLRRIGVPATSLKPDLDTLCYLQQQHLLHVPFENIDIHNRVPFLLDTAWFYEKIVLRQRGGYCYECNGLFFELLAQIGFRVRMISCRVLHRRHIGLEFDHMALVVTIDDADWLVDVGFGDFSLKPLPLQNQLEASRVPTYGVEFYGGLDAAQYLSAGKWSEAAQQYKPVYIFTTAAHKLADFAAMNLFHQTSADSHFTRNLICSKPTSSGRISLLNNRLIVQDNGSKKEDLLYTPAAQQKALTQYFGLPDTLLLSAT